MFEWNDNFSVKIPMIDEQHKKLFEIGENINILLKDHVESDNFDEILEQIDELANYTKHHFEDEEKMLKDNAYEDFDAHILEHKKFLDYLDELDFDAIDDNQEETLKELIKFIAGWIFKHINNVDFKYSEYIVEKLN